MKNGGTTTSNHFSIQATPPNLGKWPQECIFTTRKCFWPFLLLLIFWPCFCSQTFPGHSCENTGEKTHRRNGFQITTTVHFVKSVTLSAIYGRSEVVCGWGTCQSMQQGWVVLLRWSDLAPGRQVTLASVPTTLLLPTRLAKSPFHLALSLFNFKKKSSQNPGIAKVGSISRHSHGFDDSAHFDYKSV